MGSEASTVVAAFDFDKTITTCDSLLPFLIYTQGRLKAYAKLFVLIPYFIGFILKQVSRQQVKEKVLASFFNGQLNSLLEVKGKYFADHILDRWIKPEAIERLKWHQKKGHQCVLVSASLDVYLREWAKRYGFENIICSSLELNKKGYVSGKLNGLNCWGPEKKRRLLNLFGLKKNFKLYVYGDSLGDKDLLEIADHPYFRKFS
jgi:phosphatidylglycerophosphatase C